MWTAETISGKVELLPEHLTMYVAAHTEAAFGRRLVMLTFAHLWFNLIPHCNTILTVLLLWPSRIPFQFERRF